MILYPGEGFSILYRSGASVDATRLMAGGRPPSAPLRSSDIIQVLPGSDAIQTAVLKTTQRIVGVTCRVIVPFDGGATLALVQDGDTLDVPLTSVHQYDTRRISNTLSVEFTAASCTVGQAEVVFLIATANAL